MSSGNVRMREIAASTSDSPDCMSLPASNSMLTLAIPSNAEDRTRLTSLMNRTSGSIAWTTFLSTSSAVAPGHSTRTITTSIPKSGRNWVLSLTKAKIPATTISVSSRLAALR